MGTYATNSDVGARLAGRTFSASSKPSTTQVDAWIDEAEAMLVAALSGVGITTPVTTANGLKLMRSWACDYAEGHTRRSLSSGGDLTDVDGKEQLDKFDALLIDIRKESGFYQACLEGSAGDATRKIKGWALEHADELEDPIFEVGGDF